MSATIKKPQHVFTQEHAIRMYNCLRLVYRGLETGRIKSKPIIVEIPADDPDAPGIESMNNIVAAAMNPNDTKLAVGFPAAPAAAEAK